MKMCTACKAAVAAALALAFFSGCFLRKESGVSEMNSYKSVSMKEAKSLMKTASQYVLLDVRRQDEYDSGHIPGAVLLPNESISEETAASVISDKEQAVFVYCRSGRRSKEAGRKLAQLGFCNVIEIGGILDWDGVLEKSR